MTETAFDGSALRTLVVEEDDVDDEIEPVACGECKDYSDRDNAPIVAAAATTSASAAACAGSASAGAAGGSCKVGSLY